MSWFVDNYVKGRGKVKVLDVGSYDVNGCIRPLFDGTEVEYFGLDKEHRYTLDCYRYLPDGFKALAKWAGFQVINATAGGVPLLDVPKDWDCANDTLMIIIKSDSPINPDDYPALKYERRIRYIRGDGGMWFMYAFPRIFSALKSFKYRKLGQK